MYAITSWNRSNLVDRIKRHFREHGFGPCAAELRQDGTFIGFIGLNIPLFQSHFTTCVEIGRRLAAEHWGRRLATEGAQAVVRYGFETLGFEEIVSFTVPANTRSTRVMKKLGMTHSPADDFAHPRLPNGHPLRRHVLYRLGEEMSVQNPTSARFSIRKEEAATAGGFSIADSAGSSGMNERLKPLEEA
jgi:RimJ/RimL family protein N-acetyltransferase